MIFTKILRRPYLQNTLSDCFLITRRYSEQTYILQYSKSHHRICKVIFNPSNIFCSILPGSFSHKTRPQIFPNTSTCITFIKTSIFFSGSLFLSLIFVIKLLVISYQDRARSQIFSSMHFFLLFV